MPSELVLVVDRLSNRFTFFLVLGTLSRDGLNANGPKLGKIVKTKFLKRPVSWFWIPNAHVHKRKKK